MAFDRNSEGKPLVDVEKRTTQVNIWIVIGVAIFLLIIAGLFIHERRHPAQTQENAAQDLTHKP